MEINVLSTQTLVHMQRVANQELVNREQVIDDHLVRSQEKEDDACREIEALKKEQERLIKENEKGN